MFGIAAHPSRPRANDVKTTQWSLRVITYRLLSLKWCYLAGACFFFRVPKIESSNNNCCREKWTCCTEKQTSRRSQNYRKLTNLQSSWPTAVEHVYQNLKAIQVNILVIDQSWNSCGPSLLLSLWTFISKLHLIRQWYPSIRIEIQSLHSHL